jgi:hypothetical protein
VRELTGIERPQSRGSVNFSYPTGSRPTSPIAQKRLTSPSPSRPNPPRISSPDNQNLIYDANSRRFIPAHQFYAINAVDQTVQDAANKPVKKKKKVSPQQMTGTHLADGTIGGKPRGTAVDAIEAAEPQVPNPLQETAAGPAPILTQAASIQPAKTTPKKKKQRERVIESDSESEQGSLLPNLSAAESDSRTNGFNTRPGQLLAKKPSMVREDPEREEEEDDTPRAKPGLPKLDTGARQVSPTPLSRSAAGRGHGRGQAAASAALVQELQPTRSASQPAPVSPITKTTAEGLSPTGSIRVQSVSPARTAHFASAPDSLVVKHQPPIRSISPRKSALKNSNSPRGPSPVFEGGSETGRGIESIETSNVSSLPTDELSLPRKKAVRVSFDESNMVVGSAASPVGTEPPVVQSSQQGKNSWFSIGRGKKKDVQVTEDSDDEIMKPRPALPSFGSVRSKRDTRENTEERALVKPAEPVDTTSALPTAEASDLPTDYSNDHNVGAVLSQEASSKNAANILKSREPLPPQALSAEETGCGSDTDSSVSGQRSPLEPVHGMNPQEEVHAVGPEIDPSRSERETRTPTPTLAVSKLNGSNVPGIAIVEATPVLEHPEWPDVEHMPGGWDISDSGSINEELPTIIEPTHTDPTTPATIEVAEPPPTETQTVPPVLGGIVAEQTHTIPAILEETEESDTSVYSDAAEDLSDTDGDGFQSLNAVVEGPIVACTLPGLATTTPPESPTVRLAREKANKSQSSNISSEPELDEGWDKAQEYWKGLSAEKRRQLEREARDEAEDIDDSDSTIEAKPVPKPKIQKKTDLAPVVVGSVNRQLPSSRTYMIQPGSKAGADGHTPAMRSSLRAEPTNGPEETHIRKSMRGPGAMRGSVRSEEGKGPKKSRPVSLPPPKSDQVAAKTHVRNLSAASAVAARGAAQRDMAPAPVLRRQGSGDSDTSFKRARKPNEGSSMRRSMRSSGNERPQSPMRSSRFSLRSLSPTGSTNNKSFNSGAAPTSSQTHMRNSPRNSAGPAPTLRGPKPEKKSRLGGFGRSSSAKAEPNAARKSSSRFADSSDEEDVRPAFRSRFADSDDSDDEVPAPRASGFSAGTMRATVPVRGGSKRGGNDGDSSDLSDSDDEKRAPKLALKTGSNLNDNKRNAITTNAQGSKLASGSLRRSGSGRDTLAIPTNITTVTAGNSERPNHTRRGSIMSILLRKKPDPASKVRKPEAESAARRDTPLERSKADLEAVKRQDSYTSTSANGFVLEFPKSPKSPKLKKKQLEWPLPPQPKTLTGEDERPFSAGAGNGATGAEEANGTLNGDRPDLGSRRFTATGLEAVDLNAAKGKKKKFKALRKLFRLDD